MPSDFPPFLEAERITKSFPGVKALVEVSLTVGQGESVAIIGENGAGKSTLMKILAGIQPPDGGMIKVNGELVELRGVKDAMRLGIALIHQELNLCDNLTVGANIFLGREPRVCGCISHRQIREQSVDVLRQVGLSLSPETPLAELSIGQQQLVEIAKALSCNARLLIMDEPTSSLSSREVEALFTVIQSLRAKGVSILYISHRLGEVRRVSDRVVALRDGQNSGELAHQEITHENMVRLMVGRDLSQFYPHVCHPPGELVLQAAGLRTPTHPEESLDFELRRGEIVGLSGLVGAGRTELLNTLFGIAPAEGGEIQIEGQACRIRSPRDAIAQGVFLVPEDRKLQGLVLEMDVRENLSLPALGGMSRMALVDGRRERSLALEMIDRMRVKTPGPAQVIRYLSGGNQQKVVIAKWLAMKPKVLLLDEPTRGIDIGAKHEIYELMESLAKQGVAILFVSSELEEILGMADRALVMHEGRLAGCLTREQLSEEAVMHLATGGPLQAEQVQESKG
ncbi:MAG: sugar ABC transporter ATP-binding protein [Pirellulaceae bacterium]